MDVTNVTSQTYVFHVTNRICKWKNSFTDFIFLIGKNEMVMSSNDWQSNKNPTSNVNYSTDKLKILFDIIL